MIYQIRFHPFVARDLDAIAHWMIDYAGPDTASRKLAEIEAAIATLKSTPHEGSLRDEIAPSLACPFRLEGKPSSPSWLTMTQAKC